MSEKITFGELIESIAGETNQSKQFTHDFFKDFVDVIHEGLENDGKVNIAGLGKFTLKRVDEREGYNPQTEEKITIPAHNKVVFKPYKDLRERVNEPYADLEPELLGEEDETNQQEKQESESTSSSETVASTPDSKEKQDSDADVVEFSGTVEKNEEEELDRELNEFINGSESEEEAESEADQTETVNTKDIAAEPTEESEEKEPIREEETEEKVPVNPKAKAGKTVQEERRRNNALSYIAAAAGVLLILFAGAWYLDMFSTANNNQMASKTAVNSAATGNGKMEKPNKSAGDKADNVQKNDASKNRQVAQNTTSSGESDKESQQKETAKTQKDASDQSSSKENVSIEKGMTLWSLAEEKYGNPRLWPWIYGNNGRLSNPDLIIAGNSLSVPLPSGPQNSLTETDSVGVSKGFLATYRWYKDNKPSKAKNHLWAATLYHENIRNIADVEIDEDDLSYAMNAR